MSDNVTFAERLSTALGPLYSVSLANADGHICASFGSFTTDEVTRIPLPNSDDSVLISIKQSALYMVERLVQDLMPSRREFTVTHLENVLEELIAMAEAQIGRPISEMSRPEKRHLVRLLDERGAFTLRKSVETLADLLGVTRITVYNYLDWVRRPESSMESAE
jgi:hypothetical protein